jgi:hypothetical protein
MIIKASTRLIEIENGSEWRVERRTRGQDADSGDPTRPTQTWVVILKNAMGHRQFIPETRLEQLFRPFDAPVATMRDEASSDAGAGTAI